MKKRGLIAVLLGTVLTVFSLGLIYTPSAAPQAEAADPTVTNLQVNGTSPGPYTISWVENNAGGATSGTGLRLLDSSGNVVGWLTNSGQDCGDGSKTIGYNYKSPFTWQGGLTCKTTDQSAPFGGTSIKYDSLPVQAGTYKVRVEMNLSGFMGGTVHTDSSSVALGTSTAAGGSATITPAAAGTAAASSTGDIKNPSITVSPCTGSTMACFVVSIITSVCELVKSVFTALYTFLVVPAMLTILTIQPHQIQFAAVILQGWVIVRNILNIVFVLSLIAIGLMTLFGMGSFDAQSWLIKIVTNAILVNFSLVIAQTILGVADTLQAQFLPNNSDALKMIGAMLIGGVDKVGFSGIFARSGDFSEAIGAIVGVFMSFCVFLVLIMITFFLAMRLVMLWVLLLFSPAAYALKVVPMKGLEKYPTMWWEMFICWAFFTPLLALGLNLTVLIANTQQQFIQNGANIAFPNATRDTATAATFTYNILSMFIVLALLMMFEKAAKSAACAGAGVVVDRVSGYARSTATGKGAFSDLNTGRNWTAGQAARFGERMNRLQGNGVGTKFAKALGKTSSFAAGTLTADKLAAEKIKNIPILGTFTKEGRETAAARREAALKDLHERTLTGVNPTGARSALDKEKNDKQVQKYAAKTAKELQGFLEKANDSEKAIIMQSMVETGKLERVMKLNPNFQQYNVDSIKDYVNSIAGQNTGMAKSMLESIDKKAQKSNQMVAVGISKNTEAERWQARKDHFDTLSAEEKIKINVTGLGDMPAGLGVGDQAIFTQQLAGLKDDMYRVFQNMSVTEQNNVGRKIKEFIDVAGRQAPAAPVAPAAPAGDDADENAHPENNWQ